MFQKRNLPWLVIHKFSYSGWKREQIFVPLFLFFTPLFGDPEFMLLYLPNKTLFFQFFSNAFWLGCTFLIIHYNSSWYYERYTIIKLPGVCICLVSPYLLCKFQPSPPSHLQSITRCLYLYLYCWHLQITWGLYLFLANLSVNSHLLLLNHNQLFLSPPPLLSSDPHSLWILSTFNPQPWIAHPSIAF